MARDWQKYHLRRVVYRVFDFIKTSTAWSRFSRDFVFKINGDQLAWELDGAPGGTLAWHLTLMMVAPVPQTLAGDRVLDLELCLEAILRQHDWGEA